MTNSPSILWDIASFSTIHGYILGGSSLLPIWVCLLWSLVAVLRNLAHAGRFLCMVWEGKHGRHHEFSTLVGVEVYMRLLKLEQLPQRVHTALVPFWVWDCLGVEDLFLLTRPWFQQKRVWSRVCRWSRSLALYIVPLGWRSWLLRWMRVIVLIKGCWFSLLVDVFVGCILLTDWMVFSLLLLKARSSLCTEREGAIYASCPAMCCRKFTNIA